MDCDEPLNELCAYHAPLEHGSEVTWGLYLIHRLGLSVDSVTATTVVKMKDNCALVLLRDLDSKGRVVGQALDWSDAVSRAESADAPNSSDWLMAYEFVRNGWAKDASFVSLPYWKELLTLDVAFFESPPPLTMSSTHVPPVRSDEPSTDTPSVERASEGTTDSQPQEPSSHEAEGDGGDLNTADAAEALAESADEAVEVADDEEAEPDLDDIELLSFLGGDRY